MDELGEAGVIAPPEEPELPAPGRVVPSPHAQHVCCHAPAEAAQDGVLLGHREEDGRRGGPFPHKASPFDPGQISLKETKKKIDVRLKTNNTSPYPSCNPSLSLFCLSVPDFSHSISKQPVKAEGRRQYC